MSLTTQLTHRLEHLGGTATVIGVVVAQPAAVGVERQFADAGDQVAVSDELAPLALLAKAEILELKQHRDREAVVDGSVFESR